MADGPTAAGVRRLAGRGSVALAGGLLWFTLAWNVVEGVVAVSSGFRAGSVALVGFGFDSFIEVAAAAALIWRIRLPDHDERAEARERIAHRAVGATFFALSLYIVAEAIYVVATGERPEPSGVGLVLSMVSLVVMPGFGLVKRVNARRLASRALVAESTETLLCSYLSFTLFVGLAANAAAGWWWADVAAALAMVPWILREGIEGLRGDDD